MRDDIDVRLIDYWLQPGYDEAEARKVAIQELRAERAAEALFDMNERPYEGKL